MESLDERISLLEQDAYEKHTNDMDEDTPSEPDSTETIIPNNEENQENNNFDIRETQIQLNNKLDKMSETMSQFASLLNNNDYSDALTLQSSHHSFSQ
jgi:hypothetical protein